MSNDGSRSSKEVAQSAGLSDDDRGRIRAAAASGHPGDLAPEEETSRGRTQTDGPGRGGSNGVTQTRERVLNGGEFERLLIGALRIGGDRGLEAWAASIIMGRLGLRAGEMCHLSGEWVDTRERILSIPGHDPCTKGQDGGVCGDCKQAIRQRQENGDDRSFNAIAAEYWQPKTDGSVRSIPYDWSARTEEALLILLDIHEQWPHAYSTLKRRINSALENAPGLSTDATTLHGLRGTAASYHAGNGVKKEAVKQMLGWRGDRTPRKYLQIDGQMTRRALQEV